MEHFSSLVSMLAGYMFAPVITVVDKIFKNLGESLCQLKLLEPTFSLLAYVYFL